MLHVLAGVDVLLLLSAFFAYIIAPVIPRVRKRIREGARQRPIGDKAAILIVYAILLAPAVFIWTTARPAVAYWIAVTAPASVDKLFANDRMVPTEGTFARVPLPSRTRGALVRGIGAAARSLERDTRHTLAGLIEAARYARWLVVVPVVAFVLLAGAPAFQRSALRVLPRGHLQWRLEEYLRDVNSALAGYVRAQAAAGLIVGLVCVVGFLMLGVDAAISLGVVAGILELVPGIGPLVALLVAAAHSERTIAVVVFLGIVRVFQDYAIYPRLVRHGMHLSTPAVILTVWAGAALAGALGVIVAIPIAGCVSVSVRHWREYREIERLLRTRAAAARVASTVKEPLL